MGLGNRLPLFINSVCQNNVSSDKEIVKVLRKLLHEQRAAIYTYTVSSA